MRQGGIRPGVLLCTLKRNPDALLLHRLAQLLTVRGVTVPTGATREELLALLSRTIRQARGESGDGREGCEWGG